MNLLRQNLERLLSGLIILSACSALPLAEVKAADVQGGYSHDAGRQTTNPDWMNRLQDNRLVSWLMLPGTHDTMAQGVFGDSVQTQSMSLRDQLESGIRALDIRCRAAGDITFYVVHGAIEQDATFNDVLDDVTAFLKAHPREAVFLRLKQEDPIFKGSPEKFEKIFRWYLNNPKYSEYFWVPPQPDPNLNSSHVTLGQIKGSVIWTTPSDITIGDVRKKIVILQEFESTTTPPIEYGIPWNSITKQDNWYLSTNWALYDKWLAVKNQLNLVNTTNDKNLYANFLSGNGGSFPYFVASGKSSRQTGAPLLWTGLLALGPKNRDLYTCLTQSENGASVSA